MKLNDQSSSQGKKGQKFEMFKQANWTNINQTVCHIQQLVCEDFLLTDKDWQKTNLEVQRSLVCQISLVPSQSYYNIWTGLSLKLFHPVLRPHKWLLANQTGREGWVCDSASENNNKFHVMGRRGQLEPPNMSAEAFLWSMLVHFVQLRRFLFFFNAGN